VLVQTLENQLNTHNVFFQVSRVHHEVVHVDDEPSFCKVVGEDMVHERLKGRWGVALAEEHNRRFIDPVRSGESGFPLVGLLYPNVVISPPDIEFGEISGVFESIDEIGDTRKRVSILDHMRIDVLIVLGGTERSILLWDKKEGGHLRGFRREDFPFFEILINERLQGFHLLGVERIVLCLTWDKGVVELNGVVEQSMWGKRNFRLFEHICEIRKFWGEDDQLFLLLGSQSGRDSSSANVLGISRRVVSFLP